MDARFEDDPIEMAGNGNDLMLCAERTTLCLDRAAKLNAPAAAWR